MAEETELCWTAHPARTRPRDSFLVAAVLLLTLAGVLSTFQSLFFALLALVILVVAVAAFLFPTHYRLSEWGVEERRLGRKRARPWGDFKRMQVGAGAALLSPFASPSAMDRYRGLILSFDGAEREAVVSYLREHLDSGGEHVEEG